MPMKMAQEEEMRGKKTGTGDEKHKKSMKDLKEAGPSLWGRANNLIYPSNPAADERSEQADSSSGPC